MINDIEKRLREYIIDVCEENGICANVDSNINKDEYIIVKVDEYYNKNVINPPPSVDCLVTIKNSEDHFVHKIIELKNINKPSGFNIDNVYKKFETTLNDFMSKRFKDVYHDSPVPKQSVRLYFVTDPYCIKDKGLDYETWKIIPGCKMEKLLLMHPIEYKGRPYIIKPRTPDPLISKILDN